MFGSRGGRTSSSQGFEFDLGDLFDNFGNGGRSSSHRQTSRQEENLDMEQVVELPIWDFLLGTKISIESPYSGKFRVTVPECTKP
jgi:DnaJ-class molecular chaperone